MHQGKRRQPTDQQQNNEQAQTNPKPDTVIERHKHGCFLDHRDAAGFHSCRPVNPDPGGRLSKTTIGSAMIPVPTEAFRGAGSAPAGFGPDDGLGSETAYGQSEQMCKLPTKRLSVRSRFQLAAHAAGLAYPAPWNFGGANSSWPASFVGGVIWQRVPWQRRACFRHIRCPAVAGVSGP